MSSIKQDRMADRIRQILSELLLRDVADPRLHNVTITEVKLDPELMFADIYVNALGDESRQKEILAGLKSANGFLRREVAKRIKIRNAPNLHFHWDAMLERGERMNQLLSSLHIPPPDPEDLIEDDFEFDDED